MQLKEKGYDIDRDHVDLNKIFNEDQFNPWLTDKELTSLFFSARQYRENYDEYAKEHYLICKYREADFMQPLYSKSAGYVFDDPKLNMDFRFHRLAMLMQLCAEEVAIAERKIFLSRLARKSNAKTPEQRGQKFEFVLANNRKVLNQLTVFE